MLLGLALPVLDGVDGIEAAIGRQSASPVGLVRVGVTVTASRFLAQRLPAMLADHPGLKVELVVSDRFGDMIEDRSTLPCVWARSRMRHWSCAGSGLLRMLPLQRQATSSGTADPPRPPTLQATPASCTTSDQVRTCGPLSRPKDPSSSTCPGGFLANDVSAVHLAARSGYGIALLPLFEVLDDLRSGVLVCMLNEVPAPSIPLSLVYPCATTSGATHARRLRIYPGAGATNPSQVLRDRNEQGAHRVSAAPTIARSLNPTPMRRNTAGGSKFLCGKSRYAARRRPETTARSSHLPAPSS